MFSFMVAFPPAALGSVMLINPNLTYFKISDKNDCMWKQFERDSQALFKLI